MNKPEALELAELFDRGSTTNALHRAAAAELRRLHQSETEGWRWAKECEAEVKRLTEALKKANAQTEHFERRWYLQKDWSEHLAAALEYHQNQTRPIQSSIYVLAKHKEQA